VRRREFVKRLEAGARLIVVTRVRLRARQAVVRRRAAYLRPLVRAAPARRAQRRALGDGLYAGAVVLGEVVAHPPLGEGEG